MKQVKKVYRTENDTILIVTATTEGCAGRKYVSVTANEIEPITVSEAEDRTRESLEDGELWRGAVASESTEMSLMDWVEMVINVDGAASGVDNSLYPEQIEIDGTDYIFDSRSCGCLHDEIKNVTSYFDALIELHLKDTKAAIAKAEKLMGAIAHDDVDAKVLEIAEELIGVDR